MAWKQLEPTGPHLTYLLLTTFLIFYALFSLLIKNKLHLSEPPLATLWGLIFGPKAAGLITPAKWGLGDDVVQEFTRVILGIQCFAVGIELPKNFFKKHWRSLAMLLGPVMTFGWGISALFIHELFNLSWPTSLVISACLTPTDPVLAASVLSNSKFSNRVPRRLRNLLSAESGSNDGVSFPFLYIGISLLVRSTVPGFLKKWVLITLLWQCTLGIALGLFIGHAANRLLRLAADKGSIGRASYLVFYLLLSIFCVGVASTLGVDDFLLAFSAGVGFAHDGWFASATAETELYKIIDMLLNSTMFVYFGTLIPWYAFTSSTHPHLSPGRIVALVTLILLFRRIPIVLALKRWIPDIRTYREALFAGHFGPMGVGALFLAMEARAQLENDTSEADPQPPTDLDPAKQQAVDVIWPMVCAIVLASVLVHGLSTLAVSLSGSLLRKEGERAPLLGGEDEGLDAMHFDSGDEEEGEMDEDGNA